jgi:hypothetical protein
VTIRVLGVYCCTVVVAVLRRRASCVRLLQLCGATREWSCAAVREAMIAAEEVGVGVVDTLVSVIGLPTCAGVSKCVASWLVDGPANTVPVIKLMLCAVPAPDPKLICGARYGAENRATTGKTGLWSDAVRQPK